MLAACNKSLCLPALLLAALGLQACALGGSKDAKVAAAPTPVPEINQASTVPAPVPPEAQQQFDAALALANAGKTTEAMQQFEKLAAIYPDYASPLTNLGLLQLKANQTEAAVKSFEAAVARDARSALAHNYLGVSHRQQGRFKQAEQAYLAAIEADASYAPAHLNLGVLYDLYMQKPDLALAQYEQYQQLLSTPDNRVAGWIKELKGRISRRPATAEGAGS